MNRAFTLVELLICVAIFVFMTALLVSKYGDFNQSALLTDTAYDIALALHTAQSYGLNVKDSYTSCGGANSNFNCAYGIDVSSNGSITCGALSSDPTHITLFADVDPISKPNGVCNGNDTGVTSYAITRGATISGVCAITGQLSCTGIPGQLDVTYLRPAPDAKICLTTSAGLQGCSYSYAQVTLKGTDGSTRTISVYENGQIAINNQ